MTEKKRADVVPFRRGPRPPRMKFGVPRKPTGHADVTRSDGTEIEVPIFDALTLSPGERAQHDECWNRYVELQNARPEGEGDDGEEAGVAWNEAAYIESIVDYICTAAPDMPRDVVESLHLRDLTELRDYVRICSLATAERERDTDEEGDDGPPSEAASGGTG